MFQREDGVEGKPSQGERAQRLDTPGCVEMSRYESLIVELAVLTEGVADHRHGVRPILGNRRLDSRKNDRCRPMV